MFSSALDQTIVATAVPTIVSDMHSASGYVWIGGAYLLVSLLKFISTDSLYNLVADSIGKCFGWTNMGKAFGHMGTETDYTYSSCYVSRQFYNMCKSC